MNREDAVFPFSAVVNQEQVKQALLLNAVTHEVGGVLIRGRRGTAKSTLARGLAHLLPEIDVVEDCLFSCDPCDMEHLCINCAAKLALEGGLPVARTRMKMVTLPLNATEEMVVGTLDIEKALRRGEKGFEPGILARANRSILYVDEVNLLEDHIVDILLDSAAMGFNVVEREGISFRHGARFILVGTMNPEEGDLRPQLEDRFGLCAEVDSEIPCEERAEILKRHLQFSRNPLEFESQWSPVQEALRRLILAARELYANVEMPEALLDTVANIVSGVGADGHRADIAIMNSARALAAFEGSAVVDGGHIATVAPLALNHRLRKSPLGADSSFRLDSGALLREACHRAAGEQRGAPGGAQEDWNATSTPCLRTAGSREAGTETGSGIEGHIEGDARPAAGNLLLPDRELSAGVSGRRGQHQGQDNRGRYYRSASPHSRFTSSASDIAIDATIRASAARGANPGGKPDVLPEDIKVKMRKRKSGACIVFVVDASASMGARRRLEASREAVLALLVEAYQKRDRVGMVVFKDDAARLVLSPTSSTTLASRLLSGLSPGGTTPLSHGLATGLQVLDREMSRNPAPSPVLVLISDCGANVTMENGNPFAEATKIARQIRTRGIHSIVLDGARTGGDGGSPSSQSQARKIADALGGSYFQVRHLTSGAILDRIQIPELSQAG